MPQNESKEPGLPMEFLFPYHLFPEGSHVVIYGAGNVGTAFYQQAVHDGYVKVEGVVDRRGGEAGTDGMPVEEPGNVLRMHYDYVLIAIRDREAAEEARKSLLDLGVYDREIRWDGPVYGRDDFYRNMYFKLLGMASPDCTGHGQFLERFEKAVWGSIYDHAFPYHLVRPGERIVIYGAGDIGRKFYTQALREEYVEVVGIVDRNAAALQTLDIPVYSVSRLKSLSFDDVLIAVHNPSAAEEIRGDLRQMGIEEGRILWDGRSYSRREFQENIYFNLLRGLNRRYGTYTDLLSDWKSRMDAAEKCQLKGEEE